MGVFRIKIKKNEITGFNYLSEEQLDKKLKKIFYTYCKNNNIIALYSQFLEDEITETHVYYLLFYEEKANVDIEFKLKTIRYTILEESTGIIFATVQDAYTSYIKTSNRKISHSTFRQFLKRYGYTKIKNEICQEKEKQN